MSTVCTWVYNNISTFIIKPTILSLPDYEFFKRVFDIFVFIQTENNSMHTFVSRQIQNANFSSFIFPQYFAFITKELEKIL